MMYACREAVCTTQSLHDVKYCRPSLRRGNVETLLVRVFHPTSPSMRTINLHRSRMPRRPELRRMLTSDGSMHGRS